MTESADAIIGNGGEVGLLEAIVSTMFLSGAYVTGDEAGFKVSVSVGGGAGVIVRVLVAVPLG